jgi:uncharacterized protein (TIGR03435 family)
MTPETYSRVRALFDEALEWADAERFPRLQSACASEPAILEAVMRLLKAHGSCDSFLQDHSSPIQRIGRYLVTGELGRGAMGVVYEALDPMIGRKIAVKVIRLRALTDDSEAQLPREGLFREARSAGMLSHPGIVMVFDVGQQEDLAFIAMERVEGVSLDRILASGRRFAPAEALYILRQVAAALDYAHGSGVVHRDIKPANLMLDGGMITKIADFGIAKITSMGRPTISGMLIGTPLYMSPEQIEALPPDGKSDQFSLAVVAYELLTGCRPFQADTMAALAHKIVYSERPSAQAANRELPPEVDLVLRRSLARCPKDRYSNCTEFVAALDKASKDVKLPQPNLAAPVLKPSSALPAAGGAKKHTAPSLRNLVGTGLVVACLAGILFFKAMSPYERKEPAPSAPSAEPPLVSQGPARRKSRPPVLHPPKAQESGPEGANASAIQTDVQSGLGATGAGVASGPASAEPLAFETASIKPSAGDWPVNNEVRIGETEVTMKNCSLKRLIGLAYGALDFQVLVKDSVKNATFDIVAKYPPRARKQDLSLMLRSLLEKRFNLKVRKSSPQITGYVLRVAEDGFKLKPAEPAIGGAAFWRESGILHITKRGGSMAQLADELSRYLETKVIDETRVEGAYNLDLKWQSVDQSGQAKNRGKDSETSIFTSLGQDSGLRLESKIIPVEYVLVDRIDGVPPENY